MRYILSIAVFFSSWLSISAQQNKANADVNRTIDSLNKLLPNTKQDTGKVNIQNELANCWLRKKNTDSAFIYSQKALDLATEISFKQGMAASYNTMAAIEESQGDFSEAIENYDEALKILFELDLRDALGKCYNNMGVAYMRELNHSEALKKYFASLKIRQELLEQVMANRQKGDSDLVKNKRTDVASTLNNIGNSYKDLGNYPEALRNYLSALKIAEEMGSKYGIALLNNNIGIIYKEQSNYTEALKYYTTAKKIKEELGQTKDTHYANMITNLGNVYSAQGNYEAALKNFLLALEIRKEKEDKKGIADAYHNIGNIYSNQKKYDDAIQKLFDALKIREEIEDKEGIIASYIDIGSTYTRMNKNKEAFDYLNKGLRSALAINHLEWTKNAYLNLSNLDSLEALNYSNKGNWKQASECFAKAFSDYRMYVIYRDSLLSEESTKNITRVQMAYEFEKIEAAAKEAETIAKMELKQTEWQRNYLIAGFYIDRFAGGIYF